MDDSEFETLIIAGLDALPEDILELMKNVAVVIGEKAEGEVELFGLYEGVPLTERGGEYGSVLPDKITIFKETILAAYSDPRDIKKCVRNTVWHEVAHHFGRDEEWVEAEEIRRGKTL